MDRIIEVVVEDKESDNRIIIASFKKPISLTGCSPRDLAQELFKFLFKKAGKPMSIPNKVFGSLIFFPQLLNKKPFERVVVIKEVELK